MKTKGVGGGRGRCRTTLGGPSDGDAVGWCSTTLGGPPLGDAWGCGAVQPSVDNVLI